MTFRSFLSALKGKLSQPHFQAHDPSPPPWDRESYRPTSEDLTRAASGLLKLNLGCGAILKSGYLNVDKYGHPDVCHDLEIFPWPWEDNSVCEIVLHHVLEHLGQLTSVYLTIIKALYRICCDGAILHIEVPHPRHNDFVTDPTHVRPITVEGMMMFSQRHNRSWIESGAPNTPLRLYHDVNFEVIHSRLILDPVWRIRRDRGIVTDAEIARAVHENYNVVNVIPITMKAIK